MFKSVSHEDGCKHTSLVQLVGSLLRHHYVRVTVHRRAFFIVFFLLCFIYVLYYINFFGGSGNPLSLLC